MEDQGINKQRWWVLAGISLGVFLCTVNNNNINVALPTMARDFKVSLNLIQWIILIYLLVVAAVLPVMGRLADLLGRKRVYCMGILIVMAGALASSAASNFWLLLGARAIMAVGAAMPVSSSMAIVTTVFPKAERGRALGIIGAIIAMGTMAGPAMGGFLTAWGGWPWVFLANIPLGLVAFFTNWRLMPQDMAERKQEPFDYPGAVLFVAGMAALLLTISRGQDWGWVSLATGLTGITAIIFLILFVFVERKASYPLVDLRLFQIGPFSTGLILSFIFFMATTPVFILAPFYLQDLLGYSPSKMGFLMLPTPVVMILVAPWSGYLSDRMPPGVLTTIGLLISAISMGWIASIHPGQSIGVFLVSLSLLGFGIGLFQSPNTSIIMGSVPSNKRGAANGMNSLIRYMGKIMGTSIMVGIFTSVESVYLGTGATAAGGQTTAFLAGWRAAIFVAAGVAGVGVIISSLKWYSSRLAGLDDSLPDRKVPVSNAADNR